jgi:hypothetical protein
MPTEVELTTEVLLKQVHDNLLDWDVPAHGDPGDDRADLPVIDPTPDPFQDHDVGHDRRSWPLAD